MADLKYVTCVEDDPDIRSIIELALADIGGLNVTLFNNGAEAIGNIDESTELIILDMMMPEMNGLETLEKIRENKNFSTTPVIFMTAKAQPHEITHYKKAGAVDVILKPFNPMTLSDQVKDIWHTTQ